MPSFVLKSSRELAMYDLMFIGLCLMFFAATAMAIVAMGKI
jgi:hypothetical protein